jgi:hypothetical protein
VLRCEGRTVCTRGASSDSLVVQAGLRSGTGTADGLTVAQLVTVTTSMRLTAVLLTACLAVGHSRGGRINVLVFQNRLEFRPRGVRETVVAHATPLLARALK